jgi:nicotinate-nucleotide adenylyltransferase
MRIGCLFGTFDPPHRAHIAVASHLLHAVGLDQVWLVVTPRNPFKLQQRISANEHRMAMVRIAVQGHPGLVASGAELDLPSPNYTVDTLRHFRERWPEHTFDLIIGGDNLASFHKWKQPGEILSHHRLLVYPRGDGRTAGPFVEHPQVLLVQDAPLLPDSATAIREAIKAGGEAAYLLDPAVSAYISQHGLYHD